MEHLNNRPLEQTEETVIKSLASIIQKGKLTQLFYHMSDDLRSSGHLESMDLMIETLVKAIKTTTSFCCGSEMSVSRELTLETGKYNIAMSCNKCGSLKLISERGEVNGESNDGQYTFDGKLH
jgi:hypothetical protein